MEAGSPIRGTVPVPEKLRKFVYYSAGYDYGINHERSRAMQVASAFLKIGSFEAGKQVPEKAMAFALRTRREALRPVWVRGVTLRVS